MAKPYGRAFHGRWPNRRVGAFHGRCQITGSCILQEMPNHGVAHFTGDAKSRGRAFHRRCQITWSRISQEMPNHRIAHFTGDAKSRGRAFHRRCQITGSRISQEMPNHRVAHFTGDAKSQDRAFHRVAPNHRVGRSQDGAISGISRAASLTHVLHCCFIFLVFLFGFNFFFVNPFFFAICYL